MQFSPILVLHISAGMAGILSGAAAMSFRKGSLRHAQAGKVFVISMLTMAAGAVYLAIVKHQMNNVGGGILTFYLIATAWVTARRKDGETSLRLGRASDSSGERWCRLYQWFRSVAQPNRVKIRSSCWDALFYGFRVSACCRGGRSHAYTRRRFRRAPHYASSLAHVLRAIHRHRVVFPGTGCQGIARLCIQEQRTFHSGYPAADITDLLAITSSLHKCIQENVDVARSGCSRVVDIASEVTYFLSNVML